MKEKRVKDTIHIQWLFYKLSLYRKTVILREVKSALEVERSHLPLKPIVAEWKNIYLHARTSLSFFTTFLIAIIRPRWYHKSLRERAIGYPELSLTKIAINLVQ